MLTTIMVLSMTAAPIPVEVGRSIAGVRLGMTRAEVGKRHPLTPDGAERVERTGFVSGPLYFIFDAHDALVLVGVKLQQSPGLRIGKLKVPPKISAADFAKLIPGCVLSEGSGGRAVHCGEGIGLDAYDVYGEKDVSSVQLGPG